LAPTGSSWVEVPGRKLGEADTVGLRSLDSGRGGTLYVAKGKPAYPLGIEVANGGGLLTYSEWGKQVKVPVAPPQPLDATHVTLGK
jgi:hypothetical protein